MLLNEGPKNSWVCWHRLHGQWHGQKLGKSLLKKRKSYIIDTFLTHFLTPLGGARWLTRLLRCNNSACCKRLPQAKAGFSVVICNRTKSKAEVVAAECGAAVTVVDTPGEVAAQASVISVCTASEATGKVVVDAIVADARPGTIILDHSTVSPSFTNSCHAAATEKGIEYMDAPISGEYCTAASCCTQNKTKGAPCSDKKLQQHEF